MPKNKRKRATRSNPVRIELENGYQVWNLTAGFRRTLQPIAAAFSVSVEEFLRLYSRAELPGQEMRQPNLERLPIPAGFALNAGNNPDLTARIARAAAFSGRTVQALAWDAVSGFVTCCEDDMIFDPRRPGAPVGDEVAFGKFLLESRRWPVVTKAAA